MKQESAWDWAPAVGFEPGPKPRPGPEAHSAQPNPKPPATDLRTSAPRSASAAHSTAIVDTAKLLAPGLTSRWVRQLVGGIKLHRVP